MWTNILCHRNEKKKSKVCLVKSSFRVPSTFPIALCMIVSPFWWCHFFVIILNEMKVSLNRNGLHFKKIAFKILNEYNRFPLTRYQHFHKWYNAKICGLHKVNKETIQNAFETFRPHSGSAIVRFVHKPFRP